MDTPKPNLVVVTQALPSVPATQTKTDPKDLPKPVTSLPKAEKPIWKYVVESLAEYGLIHRTDALTIHIIVKTFARWVDAESLIQTMLDTTGTYFVTTPNGFEQPHQMYYVARDLKKELLRWLPEACLTITSFQKAKVEGDTTGRQSDLFGNDPLAALIATKPRLVHSQ